MKNTPRNIRIGVSFFVAYLLYQTLAPSEIVLFDNVLEYAVIVLKEAIVGLLLGFSTYICTMILNFAGQIADMEIGLSMIQALDPSTNLNISITASLYNYAFTMMLIASGMYRYLLGALADTFTLIPVNGAVFHSDDLIESMTRFMGDYVIIAFRIILPIFASILMLNAILGIMAKVAPQMHMFSIGVQLKIILGLGVLFLTFGMMSNVSDFIYTEIKTMLVSFVGAMT